MWRILCCLAIAAVPFYVYGQKPDAVAQFTPVLTGALTGAVPADDLASRMAAAVPPPRQISRDNIRQLADALEGAMTGRNIGERQAAVVSRCIVGLLGGSHASNFALAARLRDALTALRVGDERTDLIVRRFVETGGPEDSPVERSK